MRYSSWWSGVIPLLCASLAQLSCSATSSTPSEPPVGLSANALRVVLPNRSVAPGDSFECYYTDIKTDRELFVNGSAGKQGDGGHHVTIYYTEAPEPPGHHPCDDTEMLNWRQIGAAGSEAGNGVVDLPAGIAMRVPAGKQIVVQSHYINTTQETRVFDDEITVRLLDRSAVKAFASQYAIVDSNFRIPPRAKHERSATCTVARDLDLLLILGHMHEWGSHYKLERLNAEGQPAETIFDFAWEPLFTSHPPTKRWDAEKPYRLTAGTRIRQTCSWENTTDSEMRFPREMCLAYSYYLGDDGFLQCEDLHEN